MPKQLIINGQNIALYEFNGKQPDLLHIKVLRKCPEFVPQNEFEEYVASIIAFIEEKEISKIGYLNV